MNRKMLLFIMVGLLILAVSLMVLLVVKQPDKLLPASVRQSVGKMLGVDLLNKDADTSKTDNNNLEGWNEAQWVRPVTKFADDSRQQVNSSILSMGFEDTGFERVLLRGQFGQWSEVALGELTGRASFTIRSAGEDRVVYMGNTVKMYCTPRVWYDKYGKPHDLTTVMMDYSPYLDEAQLITSEEVKAYFVSEDELAVIARYSDSILEALMLIGFDCEL